MSTLTAREKLERLNNGSIIDATFEECNRLAKEHGLTVHTAKKVKNARYCIMHKGKELLCKDNLLVMHKFCQDSTNLIALAETQSVEPQEVTLTTGQFWNILVCEVIKLKNTPESIRIDADGAGGLYANLNKADIHTSDRKVWVELSRHHTLTLFDRNDYDLEDLKTVTATPVALVRTVMGEVLKLSTPVDLTSVLSEQ